MARIFRICFSARAETNERLFFFACFVSQHCLRHGSTLARLGLGVGSLEPVSWIQLGLTRQFPHSRVLGCLHEMVAAFSVAITYGTGKSAWSSSHVLLVILSDRVGRRTEVRLGAGWGRIPWGLRRRSRARPDFSPGGLMPSRYPCSARSCGFSCSPEATPLCPLSSAGPTPSRSSGWSAVTHTGSREWPRPYLTASA